MAGDRPGWVIKDLSSILGLDSDSIAQLVLPDLESYSNETRLKSHLQDFLGPTPQAKAFIDKYTSHRFPRLPSQPAPAVPAGPSKPLFSQPSAYSGASAARRAKAAGGSGKATPSGAAAGAGSAPTIQDALESAFGPGGKVYQKNRDADTGTFSPGSAGPAGSRPAHGAGIAFGGLGGASASASGSGAQTPSHQHQHQHHPQQASMRRAGAVTITEARPKPAASNSDRASQKGKQRQEDKIWDYPKSKATIKLESLLADLRKLQEGVKVPRRKDAPEEDCFCQALSRLIMRVEDDIAAQLGREQDARDAVARRKQLAAQAEAAFPSLSGPGTSNGSGGTSMSHLLGRKEEGRKVLTIGAAGAGKGKGKGKGRVTLTTTTSAPSPSAVEDELEEEDESAAYAKETVPRPRSPPMERARLDKELVKHLKWREEEDRPFGDMKAAKKGEVWKYVELPIAILPEEGGSGRRKKKGGGGQGIGGREVPGAKPVTA